MKIIKNTTSNPVPVSDVGITVPLSGQYTIPAQEYLLWAQSSDANTLITNGTLVVNDGVKDLSVKNGLAFLTDLEIRTKNIIDVSKDSSSYADFFSIAMACDAITDAAEDNLYMIRVAPGIYIEPEINVPAFVNIIGSTISKTWVLPDSSNHNVFNISNMVELSFMTVSGAGAGYAGIDASNCGDYGELHKVSIFDCDTGVLVDANSDDAIFYAEYVDINGVFTNGIKVVSSGGYEAFLNFENGYFFPGSGIENDIKIDGVNSSAEVLACGFNGIGTDTGILVTNGASLSARSAYFVGFNKAICADVNGTNPYLDLGGISFADCVTNLCVPNETASGHFEGYSEYSKNNINDLNSFFIANKDTKIVTVAKRGGDFESVADACDAITDATVVKKYLVSVGPGIFYEPLITVPKYVSVKGESINSTVIVADADDHHIFDLGNEADLSFMTVSGAGAGYAGITSSQLETEDDWFMLHKVSIFDCDTGVLFGGGDNIGSLYLEYVDIDGYYTTAVRVTSENGNYIYANLENFYTYPVSVSGSSELVVDGPDAEMYLLSCGIAGVETEDGILVTNGAQLRVQGSVISDCNNGVYADVSGATPRIVMNGMTFVNCTLNFNIENTTATGYYSGYTEFLKRSINKSNDFFITNKDDHIITVAKKGGDFSTVHEALDAIYDIQDEGEIYTVSVGPGEFLEPLLSISDHIVLRGESGEATIIKPDGSHDIIDINGHSVSVYNIKLKDSVSGYYACKIDDAGTDIDFVLVEFEDCVSGVYVRSFSKDVRASFSDCDFSGSFSSGVEVVSTSGYECYVSTVTTKLESSNTSMNTPFLSVTGNGSKLECPSVRITGPGGGAEDIGVRISDAAQFRCNGNFIRNCKTGLYVPNIGSAPNIKAMNMRMDCLTYDINIQHPSTAGHWFGAAVLSKVVNAASNYIQLAYQDPATGDFNVSRILATRGFATEMTELVTASQTTQIISTDAHVYVTTGSTAGQILRLPDATTLRKGHQIWFLNEASVDITLQNYGGSSPLVIQAESNARRILRDNSTQAGVWSSSLSASWLTGKLRDPRFFSMNGAVGGGNWITISELIPSYKYVFTESVKMIGMEWSNGNGSGRDFDLVFYKNGTAAGDIVRTYQVRNSTYDYGSATGWTDLFAAGDYMRVLYVDQGDNVSDFGGRFNFEVLT